jgi:hypothetical protein
MTEVPSQRVSRRGLTRGSPRNQGPLIPERVSAGCRMVRTTASKAAFRPINGCQRSNSMWNVGSSARTCAVEVAAHGQGQREHGVVAGSPRLLGAGPSHPGCGVVGTACHQVQPRERTPRGDRGLMVGELLGDP